jgi:hypothetical protein
MGTLLEDVFTFMTIPRYILLRIINVLHKICRQNRNTHFMSNNVVLKIAPFCEIMTKHLVQPEGPQMTSQHCAYALHAG